MKSGVVRSALVLLLVAAAACTAPSDENDGAAIPEAKPAIAEPNDVVRPAVAVAPVEDAGDERLAALLEDVCIGQGNGPVTHERLRDTPLLAGNALPWVYEPPFLIMMFPAPRNAMEEQRAERELPRTARLLGDVARRFHKSFTAPAGLPMPAAQDGVIPVFLVSDVDGMSACLGRRQRPEDLETSDALFASDPLRLVLRVTLPTRTGIHCADEGLQPTADQHYAHEAVHALTYVASGMRENGGLPFAVNEGLGFLIGTVEIPLGQEHELPTFEIRPNRIALELVQSGRRARKQRVGWFPLERVLAAEHLDDARATFAERGVLEDLGTRAWFTQSWALTYFLWNYDEGRYRERFQEYVARAWTEDEAPSLLATLGAESPEARAQIEREMVWYHDELLRRLIGRRASAGWYRPTTTPPEGTLEDARVAPAKESASAPDVPSRPPAATSKTSAEAEAKIARFLATKVIDGWSTKRTPHYLLVYDDDVDRKIVRRITKELEALRSQLLEPLFPVVRPIDAITIVRICESRTQFAAYGAPAGSAGYWSPRHEEIVLFQDRNDKKDTLRVAYVGACEAYLHQALGGMPAHAWFTLGHGDLFAGYVYKHGKFVVSPFRWRTASARAAKQRWAQGWLRETNAPADAVPDERLELREWLTWSLQQYMGRNDWNIHGGLNNALGWSFVYFLRTSDDPAHARVLTRYWETLIGLAQAEAAAIEAPRGTDAGATSDAPDRSRWRALALDAALEGVDVEQLERDWLAHTWK